jgi:Flp pilus assembly protein TadD
VRLWDVQTGEPIGPPLPHSRLPGSVTTLSWSAKGELLTEAGPGTRWVRRLVGEGRPTADLIELARLLSGRQETATSQIGPAGATDLEAAYDRLTNRHAADFEVPRARQVAWAWRGAEQCEARELWVGALRHLDVLLVDSTDPALFARRGKARVQVGQYEGAVEDYDKALKVVKTRWEWWAGRAGAATSMKKWDKAAEDYTEATKLEKRRPELWKRLADVEAQRGEWKEAAQALANAIRFGTGDVGVLSDQALAQLSAGDQKGYRTSTARLVKKFGTADDAATRRRVALTCVLAPDAGANLAALVARAEKAVLASPADVEERALLAALLLRSGQGAKAVGLLEKCVAIDRPRPGDCWLLALAYQKAGQMDKAKDWLGKALGVKHQDGAPWQERQASALWRREAEGDKES